jgi:hypothetical protein
MTAVYDPTMGYGHLVSIGGTVMAVTSSTFGKKEKLLERQGNRGDRSHHTSDMRAGPYNVMGDYNLEPSAAELLVLLQYAVGASGNAADTLEDFTIIDDDQVSPFTAVGCKIGKIQIRGTQGDTLKVTASIIGKTYATAASIATAPTSTGPCQFADITLAIGGTTYEPTEIDTTIDNSPDDGRFTTGLTLPTIVERDRIVTLNPTMPYNSLTAALLALGIAGAAGVLTIYDGTSNVVLTYGKLQLPFNTPSRPGRGEITLSLPFTSRYDGTTREIDITGGAGS